MGVWQDSEILPAPSLRILEFGNFVPGSVDYVELVDALGVYNAPVSFLSKPGVYNTQTPVARLITIDPAKADRSSGWVVWMGVVVGGMELVCHVCPLEPNKSEMARGSSVRWL